MISIMSECLEITVTMAEEGLDSQESPVDQNEHPVTRMVTILTRTEREETTQATH